MKPEQIIETIDEILAKLEDYTHGEDGIKITEARKLLRELSSAHREEMIELLEYLNKGRIVKYPVPLEEILDNFQEERSKG